MIDKLLNLIQANPLAATIGASLATHVSHLSWGTIKPVIQSAFNFWKEFKGLNGLQNFFMTGEASPAIAAPAPVAVIAPLPAAPALEASAAIKVVSVIALIAALAAACLVGCTTNQLSIAKKAEVATDATVTGGLAGWGVYVATKHPGTNAELQVLHAFKAVQASEVLVVDASATLAANPTNTAPLQAAQQVFDASKSNFFTLINSITNAIH